MVKAQLAIDKGQQMQCLQTVDTFNPTFHLSLFFSYSMLKSSMGTMTEKLPLNYSVLVNLAIFPILKHVTKITYVVLVIIRAVDLLSVFG